MSRTLITIGTHANAGLNTFRMCFSKAQAVRILMARGVPRHVARWAAGVAQTHRKPFNVYGNGSHIQVAHRLHDAEAGYFARSYSELKALWQKAPEQ